MNSECGKITMYCCHYALIPPTSNDKKYFVPVYGCNLELFICEECFKKLLKRVKMIDVNSLRGDNEI